MHYSKLGETGLVVSRMTFGAMTFGQGSLVGELHNTIGQDQADRMVGAALDAGINFFDTADMYTNGQSETILGKALADKRQDVVIATKCGFRSGPALTQSGLSYTYVLRSIQGSLKRLGTDYIDLFILHIP
ncbi:MAG: aldo/keto reductase, partial [Desulfovibrio sp.]